MKAIPPSKLHGGNFWDISRPDPKAQLDAAQKAADINSQADTAAKEAEDLRTSAAKAKADAELRLDRAVAYGRERGAAATGVETARLTGSISRRDAGATTEAARISYTSGAMRTQVTDRLDSGITQLETSPTAQASPTAQKLLESAKAFRQKVDGMDMQSFLAATKEINAALDRFQVILLDAKRAAKQTTSQLARQRDAD